jgi:hypothetical protein
MAVELDESSLKVVDQPIIWNAAYAYQYAAVAPNARGTLGGIVDEGGGTKYLSCAAIASRNGGWSAYVLDSSSNDPGEPRAGDYLGISSGSDTTRWSGSCSTLRGGTDSNHENVEYFSFGLTGG